MGSLIRALMWVVVLAVIMLGFGLWVARPAVAAGCPGCFGLSAMQDGLYVQSSMAPALRDKVVAAVSAARQRIVKFYGEERFPPRVLVCADDSCYHRIGGAPGSGTGALGSAALVVSPEAVNTVALTEALSHVEMRGRVGTWKMQMGAVPMWFEEGLAVVVAEDPLYLHVTTHGDSCVAGSFPDMPATPTEWQEELEQEGDVLYAQSACKVVMWVEENGGPKAATGLLDKLSAGQEFDAVYR